MTKQATPIVTDKPAATPNPADVRQPVPMDQRNPTTQEHAMQLQQVDTLLDSVGIHRERVDLETLTDGEIESRRYAAVKRWFKYMTESATGKASDIGLPQALGFTITDKLAKDIDKDSRKIGKGDGSAMIFSRTLSDLAKSIDANAESIINHVKAQVIGAAVAAKCKGMVFNIGDTDNPESATPIELLRLALSAGSGSVGERRADLASKVARIK